MLFICDNMRDFGYKYNNNYYYNMSGENLTKTLLTRNSTFLIKQ